MRKHMTISEFIHREEESFIKKAKKHIQRNKSFYISVAGTTLIFLFVGDSAFAASRIDQKAKVIYEQLVDIGKWIIIVKGAIDIIQTASQGDMDSVKSKFIKYVITFLFLLALPWAMDEIQDLFKAKPASVVE